MFIISMRCTKCKVIKPGMSFANQAAKNAATCDICHSPLETYMGGDEAPPTVILKGSGFHSKDYPKGGKF